MEAAVILLQCPIEMLPSLVIQKTDDQQVAAPFPIGKTGSQ